MMMPVKNDRGVTAVMVAVSLVMLLGFAALTVDVGQALVARNELQDVADAAALAGARRLGVMYAGSPDGSIPPMSATDQQNFVLTSRSDIDNAVITVASSNSARGVAISIPTSEIEIGDWDPVAKTFTVTNATPNAVRVTARRDASQNGPVTTFLAGLLGINSVGVTAFATAALTGTSTTNPGDLETPFGISSFRFTTTYCSQPVRFYPTNDPIACAGWHTFTDNPPNANRLRNIIDGLIPTPPTYVTPGTQAGVTDLNFTGGSVASALPNLKALYDAKKDANGNWDALVPVYQSSDCSNPNTSLPIVGYASMRITNVLAPPDGQLVEGIIQCNMVDGGRGGGGPGFGTLGAIPGLVQ